MTSIRNLNRLLMVSRQVKCQFFVTAIIDSGFEFVVLASGMQVRSFVADYAVIGEAWRQNGGHWSPDQYNVLKEEA